MNIGSYFDNNTQFNLRLYAGKFLRNKTNTDFFSFALDRPTNYLFDYSYLGQSEDSGLYSQQLIIADGGFKSFLDERYRFSNDWIVRQTQALTFGGGLSYMEILVLLKIED